MKKLLQKNGMTLVEIIVAVSIFSVIVLAVGAFARDVFFFNSTLQSSLEVEQEGRAVLRPMVNEIRSASQSSVGSYPIEQAATSTLVFYSDIDGDGLKERIRYFLDNDILKRGIIKPMGSPASYGGGESIYTLINSVVNKADPVFYYYDSTYTGTTSPLSYPMNINQIRLVKVHVVVDKNEERPPAAVTIETQVSIRNLKDNQ